MKATLLLAALSMATAAPQSFGKSELETLRLLCKEQERQIRQLEDENALLRDEPVSHSQAILSDAKPATPVATGSTDYTVKPGDSFTKIARRVGVSPETLAKSNGMELSSIIRPGQSLKVPSAAARKSDPAARSSTPAPSPAKAATGSHKVAEGETFSSISRKYKISTADLLAANPDVKPTELRPGQIVKLNGRAVTAPAETARQSSAAVAKAPASPIEEPVAKTTPPPAPAAAPSPAAAESPQKERVHPITIDDEMTYGAFAAKHGTDADRLNELNGLDLTKATVLAKGSELYVPAQP